MNLPQRILVVIQAYMLPFLNPKEAPPWHDEALSVAKGFLGDPLMII